ncbi:phosphoribosylglycinamide formyltransferase [Rickettsiales bacterium]|nr:phosphoribosylglycinamide formyltransferase [Rickettsiales bacterium]MDB2550278.1 phosphoribosylglycinamide formyltransferase [Rickettsiales bacterium]
MNDKIKTAIIISGFGSNMESIINYSLHDNANFEVVLVISNNPNALGLKKAEDKNIKNITINHKDYSSREKFEDEIHKELINNDCQLVCLAGFMRVLTKGFTDKWSEKMINIHPSLLPKYKGMDAIKQAFDANDKESGCTVHFVNEAVDAGQIIAQRRVEILKNDNLPDVRKKVLKEELDVFPSSIDYIAKKMRNK